MESKEMQSVLLRITHCDLHDGWPCGTCLVGFVKDLQGLFEIKDKVVSNFLEKVYRLKEEQETASSYSKKLEERNE